MRKDDIMRNSNKEGGCIYCDANMTGKNSDEKL